MRGRGTPECPPGRFERLHIELEPEEEAAPRATEFWVDAAQTIISTHESPDLSFRASVNPYRGCEHGCPYCYARPYHDFLGFSSGLDFETKILVKPRAAELLRDELASPLWRPQPLALSGVTDCYQPVERKLGLTRACLEVLRDFRQPAGVVTKNRLVTRDRDLLAELAEFGAACVHVSLTTLDAELARKLEPRASSPQGRLDAMAEMARAGIPCGVLVAPVIPGLNDHEIPAILAAAREAGAIRAAWTMLRLPHGVKDLFLSWLSRELPGSRARVEARIREVRAGTLNDARFGSRMRGEGPAAEMIARLFALCAEKLGFRREGFALSTQHFRRPSGVQLELRLSDGPEASPRFS